MLPDFIIIINIITINLLLVADDSLLGYRLHHMGDLWKASWH